MEDISKLIREARPLYFARKRRRRLMAAGMTMCVSFVLWAVAINIVVQQKVYDSWTEQIYVMQNGSVIEEMGLPVDEYGLLLVG